MADVLRLGIGLPAYGGRIAMQQAEMWMSLGHALANSAHRFELVFQSLVDVCGVEVARNKLVDDAIAKDVDWLLMLDADTWCVDGYSLLIMISQAAREGAAVVVGAVPRRGGADNHLMVYHNVDGERVPITAAELADRALVEIDAAATALMAIDLKFVRKHFAPPWFRFEWVYGSTTFTSEDLAFCRRVKEAGGRIAVDGRVHAHHLNRPDVL